MSENTDYTRSVTIKQKYTLPSFIRLYKWQDKSVSQVLPETVWSLLTRLVNESAKAPHLLPNCYQQCSLGCGFSARRGHPAIIHFRYFFYYFIHHHFFTVLFFSWKRSMFLITSGLFITNDTIFTALRRYSVYWRKWGLPSLHVLLCWWIVRYKGGRLLSLDKMLHWAMNICFYCQIICCVKNLLKEVSLAWESTEKDPICGAKLPGGGIHDTSDAREIYYAAERIKDRKEA